MKIRLLVATMVLALFLAAMPNAMAGDLAISDVTYTPDLPQQGDTIHLKAKVTSSSTITEVRAFPCWEKPTYQCGMPVSMTDPDSDGYFEADLAHDAWTDGNIVHFNITAKDQAGDEKTYTIPAITIGATNGGPKDPGDYKNEGDCKDAGYHWWDDACHENAKAPGDFKTQPECEGAGLYWWSNVCHADRGDPSVYTTKDPCKEVGYYWYDDKCHAKKEEKQEPGFIPAFGILTGMAAVLSIGVLTFRRTGR